MLWYKRQKSMIDKAKEVNEVLDALGIEAHTETGKQIRGAIGMELLGQSFDLMDKHGKATFIKQHGDVLGEVREMLIQEGILSQKPEHLIEDKSAKKTPKAGTG